MDGHPDVPDEGAKIHDCEFIDAGGRWEKGGPGIKGGITGGGIFPICELRVHVGVERAARVISPSP